MPNDTKRLKARPARIAVVRQHPVRDTEHPREQLHAWVSTRLREVWQEHFEDAYATDSVGVELGMQVILYLTGSPHINAETLAARLTKTYPGVAQSMASNLGAIVDAMGDNPDVR